MVRPTASSRLAQALVVLACVSSARGAAADGAGADQAMAQALFDEGRRLMDAHDYAHACPKFAESQRLDPGGGTILNLALCHEAEGKTASAWAEFNEALSQAIRDGRAEREARARESIASLAPRLSRLTVTVADAMPPDLQVTVDGAPLGPASRGVAVPLDPGPHLVVATAAGKPTWTMTVTLGPGADAKAVLVPSFQSRVEAGASSEAPATKGGGGRRVAGLVLGGAGIAAVGVGAAFGVFALSRRSESNTDCPRAVCTRQGVDLNNQAITAAWVSDFGVGLGVIGVVAGAYLLLTGKGDAPPPAVATRAVHVLPEAFVRGGGAALLIDWP